MPTPVSFTLNSTFFWDSLRRTNFPQKYYNSKFKQIFEEREDFISYYGKDVNIWNEFYDNITGKTNLLDVG